MNNSKIEWCDATFNPWWGCTHAGSPGCDHCYARALAGRWGFDCWGAGKTRLVLSENYWKEPLRWDKKAEKAGKQAVVFCGSMCDVFDLEERIDERERLWRLMEVTPNLFWMLLTKRPENIAALVPLLGFMPNVALGVTVETQDQVWRIEEMLKHKGRFYFVSHEPALGQVIWPQAFLALEKRALIITGGESGPKARPMHPDWVRADRDQCQENGVKFFLKQWGEWLPSYDLGFGSDNIDQWKRTFGTAWVKSYFCFLDGQGMGRVGKKAAGRLLDEREWNERLI